MNAERNGLGVVAHMSADEAWDLARFIVEHTSDTDLARAAARRLREAAEAADPTLAVSHRESEA